MKRYGIGKTIDFPRGNEKRGIPPGGQVIIIGPDPVEGEGEITVYDALCRGRMIQVTAEEIAEQR